MDSVLARQGGKEARLDNGRASPRKGSGEVKPPLHVPALAELLVGPLTFSLSGHPQGKGRARAFRRGDFIGHYTPEATRSYEGMIREVATQAMAGRAPTGEPVEVVLIAFFDVPKSFSKTKRAMALGNLIKPAKKPDIDNIIKTFVDAMNGVVFRDDCQIVLGRYAKVYSTSPKVVVTVRPLMVGEP